MTNAPGRPATAGILNGPFQAVILSAAQNLCICLSFLLVLALAAPAQKPAPAPAVSGQAIDALTQQFLAVAPRRFNGSPGHLAAEKFIKDHFKPEAAKGNFIIDEFTANTPAGLQTMRNYIVRYPGKAPRPGETPGIIVLASHYETNYPLRDIAFYGANDGACTTALLIELGAYFRTHPPEGYSIWLVFDDGEEAVRQWSDSDSLYGTRHLAAKWYADGTLKRIKAFIVADMIGDKDLNILEEMGSTPWLRGVFRQAAAKTTTPRTSSRPRAKRKTTTFPSFVAASPPSTSSTWTTALTPPPPPTATITLPRTPSTRSAPSPSRSPPTSSSKPSASSTPPTDPAAPMIAGCPTSRF